MYLYDEIDQKLVDERVVQFRDQTRRFLAGKLSDDEFRALRLRNGLYIQRYAPMLRIAIPYGLLSTKQLRKLAHIARKYDRGYGHFSTRQNLQLNWPKLPQAPDILAELATVQMHAIQTSGNSFRNITTDHFAGEMIGGDIAEGIARGLDRVHLHGGELGEDVGRLRKLRPVQLEVLSRAEMAVAAVVFAGDMRELPQLLRRQQPVRDRDPEHRRVTLDVEAVPQAQRAKFIVGKLAGEKAPRLVAELDDALVDELLVDFVVEIHERL